jgi:hypothetical protein
MFDGQMEMSFGGHKTTLGSPRRNRARLWFQRMRQVVDLAIEWQPTPRPRPIQIWFPTNETGMVQASVPLSTQRSQRQGRERQVCE